MSTHGNCPICRSPLEDSESLVAYYYPPKDWWVVAHIKAARFNDQRGFLKIGQTPIENIIIICQGARFERPRHIGDGAPG